ncbi:MAG: alcohol dehydrogenase catalytic domain-containing protein [Sphingomonadales bacterium]|nr:alcohol dehydrogenase catalytic domain-containing protein [Sphingomonadales bacterium]
MTLGRVAVLQPFGFLAIEEVEIPAPTGFQVAVEMFAAGIGTVDVALLAQSDMPDWQPIVPGIEGVGLVTAVGELAERVKVGDQVVIGTTPALPGRDAAPPVLTFDVGAIQTDRPISTWTTNAVVDEQFLSPVPRDLAADRDCLALLGDTALIAAALATQWTDAKADEAIVVAGGGGLALAAIAALRAAGSEHVIALAPGHAHASASAAGASLCLEPGEDLAATGARHGLDCGADDAGAGAPLDHAIQWIDARDPGKPLDRAHAMATLTGWIAAGTFNPSVAIGKRYTIEQINEAVMELESGRIAGAGIVVMEPLK